MMDPELLEWLSYEELQELETDDLIQEFQAKLMQTQKFYIDQIMMDQAKSQELIEEIDRADRELQFLQEFVQGNLDKLQELRTRAGPLETENSQYIVEQRNTAALSKYLSGLMAKKN